MQWESEMGILLPSEAVRQGFSKKERIKIKGESWYVDIGVGI